MEFEDTSSVQANSLTRKEIRLVLGDMYPPIITVEEAAKIARVAVKTIYKKVCEGHFKRSVRRGKPLRFWRDTFVQEVMR